MERGVQYSGVWPRIDWSFFTDILGRLTAFVVWVVEESWQWRRQASPPTSWQQMSYEHMSDEFTIHQEGCGNLKSHKEWNAWRCGLLSFDCWLKHRLFSVGPSKVAYSQISFNATGPLYLMVMWFKTRETWWLPAVWILTQDSRLIDDCVFVSRRVLRRCRRESKDSDR